MRVCVMQSFLLIFSSIFIDAAPGEIPTIPQTPKKSSVKAAATTASGELHFSFAVFFVS